jgi:hypothetical protein
MTAIFLLPHSRCRPLEISGRFKISAAPLVIALVLLGVLGCSSAPVTDGTRKPVHRVRGKMLVGGQPAKGAFVLLVPVNEPAEPADPRPRAEVRDDGSFAISTYGVEDGAPVGEYIVTVTWPGGVLPDGREEPPDKLLGKFSSPTKSKLRATVKEGANELTPYDL